MSIELLKRYINEVMMNQNIIKKDPAGTSQLVIRKLVTFKKPTSRFGIGDDVDTELTPQGDVIVDDLEKWEPVIEPDKPVTKPHHRRRHRRA